jgi:hypothetical protein
VDIAGGVELSVALGTVKGAEWEKAPLEARLGVIKQLFTSFLLGLTAPDGVDIPNEVEPYRPPTSAQKLIVPGGDNAQTS